MEKLFKFIWRRKNRAFCKPWENFAGLQKSQMPFCKGCEKFVNPLCLANCFTKLKSLCKLISHTQNCFAKTLQNLKEVANSIRNLASSNNHVKNQRSSKNLFKAFQTLNPFRTPHFPFPKSSTTLPRPSDHRLSLYSMPRDHHLQRWPTPLTSFLPWRALEEAIPTLQYLASPGQEPSLLKIHLRPLMPLPFHLLRVECPLSLLSADTRHEDHQFLYPLRAQIAAL